MIVAPEMIFYWTGCVVWWALCGMFAIFVIGFCIVAPIVLISKINHHLWAWVVAAKLKKYDLTREDVSNAYQNAFYMSDLNKVVTPEREPELMKFMKIFISELEGKSREFQK